MPKSDRHALDDQNVQGSQPADKTPAETRIDAPHVLDGKGAVADGEPAGQEKPAAVEQPLVDRVERTSGQPANSPATACQLRAQAEQLATHLRTRQTDVDRREAQLNASLAQLDSDTRGARLWLGQRQQELIQRSTALDERHREVQEQLSQLAAAKTTAGRSRQESAEDLARRQEDLRRRQAELDALAEQLSAQAAAQKDAQDAFQAERRRTAEALQSRQEQLEQAEVLLVDAREETKKLRQQLVQDRRKLEREARTEGQRLAAQQHRRDLAELESQRRSLQRRSEHVDHCRAALEQLKTELGRLHRETLEIRLATEELWVELSGAAPPAALTRSLGRVRARLADHYRLANSELAEQKQQLQTIGNQVSEQHQRLLQQKRRLDEWAARQQEETQRQAARLVARERELQRREAEFNQQAQRWQTERLGYEQEIRRLRARPHEPTAAAGSE